MELVWLAFTVYLMLQYTRMLLGSSSVLLGWLSSVEWQGMQPDSSTFLDGKLWEDPQTQARRTYSESLMGALHHWVFFLADSVPHWRWQHAWACFHHCDEKHENVNQGKKHLLWLMVSMLSEFSLWSSSLRGLLQNCDIVVGNNMDQCCPLQGSWCVR